MGNLTDTLMPSTTPPLPTLALTAPNVATPQSSRPLPVHEDCWREDATSMLIYAWGCRYMEFNHGNLRFSNGTLTLLWIFFDCLDSLIGSNVMLRSRLRLQLRFKFNILHRCLSLLRWGFRCININYHRSRPISL